MEYRYSAEYIEMVVERANYIVENNCTIREAANHFGVTKTTLHKQLRRDLYRMSELKPSYEKLYKTIDKILVKHFNEKYIHGGETTRIRYSKHSVE